MSNAPNTNLQVTTAPVVKLVVDMNLSPDWVQTLTAAGFHAVHWSKVGDPRATDQTILDWARQTDHIVFTHDFDFGTLLALTHARGPSVLQVRTQNITPQHAGPLVVAALQSYWRELVGGALLVVYEHKSRVRILPLTPP